MRSRFENAFDHLLIEDRHYNDPALRRREDYDGPAKIWPEDEARAVLIALLDYFGGRDGFRLPCPPSGLPGAQRFTATDDAMDLLQLGFNYFFALVHDRNRDQIDLARQADKLLRDKYAEGRGFEERRWLDAQRARSEAEMNERLANFRDKVDDRLVYFIASESGPIKIGLAANPAGRLKNLQTAHHEKLSMLATVGGGFDAEQAYHARFAAHRLNGEWFERHPDILAEIERLAA